LLGQALTDKNASHDLDALPHARGQTISGEPVKGIDILRADAQTALHRPRPGPGSRPVWRL